MTAAYLPAPCTCTVACIPQGISEEQTCRLRLDAEQRVYGELEALRELVETDALDKDELRAAAWVLIERVDGLREDLRRLERARASWQREALQ